MAEAQPAPDQNDPVALYDKGMGAYNVAIDKDNPQPEKFAEARKYLEQAAAQKYALAVVQLGYMKRHNQGFDLSPTDDPNKNDRDAIELYKQAADDGYKMAQENMAWAYRNGTGVEKNEDKAKEWDTKAANGLDNQQYDERWKVRHASINGGPGIDPKTGRPLDAGKPLGDPAGSPATQSGADDSPIIIKDPNSKDEIRLEFADGKVIGKYNAENTENSRSTVGIEMKDGQNDHKKLHDLFDHLTTDQRTALFKDMKDTEAGHNSISVLSDITHGKVPATATALAPQTELKLASPDDSGGVIITHKDGKTTAKYGGTNGNVTVTVPDPEGNVIPTIKQAWDKHPEKRQDLIKEMGQQDKLQKILESAAKGPETSKPPVSGPNQGEGAPVANFAQAKSDIPAEQLPALHSFAEDYKAHGNNGKIHLNGYADKSGSQWSNIAYGQQRADAVKKYLVEVEHIDKDLITTGSGGQSNPMDGPPEASRRVTATIYTKDEEIKPILDANAKEHAAADLAQKHAHAAKPHAQHPGAHKGNGSAAPVNTTEDLNKAQQTLSDPAATAAEIMRDPDGTVSQLAKRRAESDPAYKQAVQGQLDKLKKQDEETGPQGVLKGLDKGEFQGGYRVQTSDHQQIIVTKNQKGGGYNFYIGDASGRQTGAGVQNVPAESAAMYIGHMQNDPDGFAKVMPTAQKAAELSTTQVPHRRQPAGNMRTITADSAAQQIYSDPTDPKYVDTPKAGVDQHPLPFSNPTTIQSPNAQKVATTAPGTP